MPNQPRADNPARAVRIPDELWARVLAAAAREGISASAFVRYSIEHHLEYAERG